MVETKCGRVQHVLCGGDVQGGVLVQVSGVDLGILIISKIM